MIRKKDYESKPVDRKEIYAIFRTLAMSIFIRNIFYFFYIKSIRILQHEPQ